MLPLSVRYPLTLEFGALDFGSRGNPACGLDAETRKVFIVTIYGFCVFTFIHNTRADTSHRGTCAYKILHSLALLAGSLHPLGLVG